MKKLSLVMTTIGNGEILKSIYKQTCPEAMDELGVIVIPDRKSPKELFDRCEKIKNYGFKIQCPTVMEQNDFLKTVGLAPKLIPYDSDNRRNIGYLMALDQGSDIIVSLDDDNYPIQSLRDHLIVGDETSLPTVFSNTQWFNVCDLLRMDKDHKVYLRGFPYYKRHRPYEIKIRLGTGRVGLNLGLWIGDPDFDAMTWLTMPVKSISFNGNSFLLGRQMWTPINTQNTAVYRDVMQSYYYVRMGAGIERFGDIFSGYFCQKCIKHMGDRIRVGTPIVNHKRNSHDYLTDSYGELPGILILEDLLPWLEGVKLTGSTYAETYTCLADMLDFQMPHFKGLIWTREIKQYFSEITFLMREWVKVCQRIG